MNQLYEINLPQIDNIVNKTLLEFNDDNLTSNFVIKKLEDNLFSNYKNFLNFSWDELWYFKKNNIEGYIHTDLGTDYEHNIHNKTVWAVNFITGSNGYIKFWQWDNVKKIGITPEKFDENSNILPIKSSHFVSLTGPNETYFLEQGKVYLINTTLPHQASGIGNRKVFSLRAKEKNINWEEIVLRFKPYIKNVGASEGT